jgi:hypothetical protein
VRHGPAAGPDALEPGGSPQRGSRPVSLPLVLTSGWIK